MIAFKKQTKIIEDQRRKQTDTALNQKERQVGLIKNGNDIFEEKRKKRKKKFKDLLKK